MLRREGLRAFFEITQGTIAQIRIFSNSKLVKSLKSCGGTVHATAAGFPGIRDKPNGGSSCSLENSGYLDTLGRLGPLLD